MLCFADDIDVAYPLFVFLCLLPSQLVWTPFPLKDYKVLLFWPSFGLWQMYLTLSLKVEQNQAECGRLHDPMWCHFEDLSLEESNYAIFFEFHSCLLLLVMFHVSQDGIMRFLCLAPFKKAAYRFLSVEAILSFVWYSTAL